MSMIEYSIDADAVATLTFNRDEKRNAVNNEMAGQLLDGLAKAESDGARVVILRAHPGAKVWCAGHDLAELETRDLHRENPTLRIVEKIRSLPLPVIAMVEGDVYAGGFIILLSADIVVAAASVRVAMTSCKLGIPLPPELSAYWLHVMGLHQAKEMLFTAEPISAHAAQQAGLFNHVVEPSQLEPTTQQLALRITQCSPEAIANAKYQLNLLARQTALTSAQQAELDQRNNELLDSPTTKQRIDALLKLLRGAD